MDIRNLILTLLQKETTEFLHTVDSLILDNTKMNLNLNESFNIYRLIAMYKIAAERLGINAVILSEEVLTETENGIRNILNDVIDSYEEQERKAASDVLTQMLRELSDEEDIVTMVTKMRGLNNDGNF